MRRTLSASAAAVIVALALAACGEDDRADLQTSQNPTDPNCRPSTCATLGKNCGIVADGCGGSLRCGTCAGTNNDCRENVCERGCRSDSECSNGTSCIAGSCSDKCSSNADCPSGQSCANGSCVANAPASCNYDADCRADERCISGQCKGSLSGYRSCTRDSNCGAAEICKHGQCTSVGARQCYRNTDCRNDEICSNGYCVRNSGGSGKGCIYDRDCPSYQHCSYGVCQNDDENRRVRAECVTRELGLFTPFGSLSFVSENWLYESNNRSSGVRVESCLCQGGVLKVDLGDSTRNISCGTCIKDGAVRTCYE